MLAKGAGLELSGEQDGEECFMKKEHMQSP